MTQPSLEQILAQVSEEDQKQPPLEKWSPPFRGDLDMRIDREGRWFYQGSEIKRKPLVKLFSSILWKEGEEYFLVTPVEKFRIQVDVAPLLVVKLETVSERGQAALVMTTLTEDRFVLNEEHPLHVTHDAASGEPTPLVLVRRNLEALIHRNVFYELVELAQPAADDPQELCVSSCGQCFSLGRL